MSAELDRLNAAVVSVSTAAADANTKADAAVVAIADLKAKVDAGPVVGVDPVAVDAAANAVEGLAPVIQSVADKLNAALASVAPPAPAPDPAPAA